MQALVLAKAKGKGKKEQLALCDQEAEPALLKSQKKKKSKGKKVMKMPEVAVGSDAGDAEEMSCFADDYDDFDDDSGYEPSIGPDVEDGEHDIEVEEIPDGGAREDDDDVIDVDEERGSVRLSKRGTLKNEARTKVHIGSPLDSSVQEPLL